MNQIECGNEADPPKKAQIDELAKKLRNSECVHSFSSKTQDNRIQFWVLENLETWKTKYQIDGI